MRVIGQLLEGDKVSVIADGFNANMPGETSNYMANVILDYLSNLVWSSLSLLKSFYGK